MNDAGRNRIVIGSIAVIAIVLGMLLIGGMPGTSQSTADKLVPATSTIAEEAGREQVSQFQVRDYNEFASQPGADLPSGDWLGLLAGMVVKLGLVVTLIYLVAMVLRRYVYRGSPVTASKKPISLLGSLHLAPNKTVYVLEVGRKVLVVGGTQNQLSLLAEVTEPDAVEEVRNQSPEANTGDQFTKLFQSATRQFGERDVTLSSKNSACESLQQKVQEGRDHLQSKLAQMRQSLRHN